MRTSFVSALLLVSAVSAQTLTINTPPSLIQCEPAQLTFSGGVGPYIIAAIPGGQPSAAPLESITTAPAGATTFSWTVNLAVGTSVTLSITDSTGVIAYDLQRTVLAGISTACLTASSTTTTGAGTGTTTTGASGSSSSTAATTSAAGATTTTSAAATTTTGASPTTTSKAATTTTSSAAPVSTTSSSGGPGSLQASSIFAALVAAAAALAA